MLLLGVCIGAVNELIGSCRTRSSFIDADLVLLVNPPIIYGLLCGFELRDIFAQLALVVDINDVLLAAEDCFPLTPCIDS